SDDTLSSFHNGEHGKAIQCMAATTPANPNPAIQGTAGSCLCSLNSQISRSNHFARSFLHGPGRY
ncbi:MAG TPA: hypothetical protein VG077_18980, partial [Verrucomicrobiae bacterium]|nr:hypothetical protein [Verrucomicrobiae bacterium]